MRRRARGTFIDGTFGAGGYTGAILDAAPDARVLAIDRDPTAIAAGQGLVGETGGRLTLVEGTFGELERIATEAGFAPADGVVLDIGVSSMQLDDPERGFSFQSDGPLDMRMGQDGPTAADIVNTAKTIRTSPTSSSTWATSAAPARVARAIVARRSEKPFTRTSELAELAERVLGRQKIAGRHAATRIFQALRIYVNDELGELVHGPRRGRARVEAGRPACGRHLPFAGGRHRQALPQASGPTPNGRARAICPLANRRSSRRASESPIQRPITAQEEELAANPRARSAKLRLATRTQAPPWPAEDTDLQFRGFEPTADPGTTCPVNTKHQGAV